MRVIDQQRHGVGELTLEIDLKNRKRTLFTDSVQTKLRAMVCPKCGYTELYASHPEELWAAHQHNQRPI